MLVFGSRAFAVDSAWNRAEPEARKRFEEVSAAYQKLPGYSDHGAFVKTVTIGTQTRTETSPLSLAFAKPNRIVLDAGEVKLLDDGKTLTTVLGPTKRYLSAPSPEKLTITPIADGPVGAILFGGPLGPPSQLLLKLVLGNEPANALPDRASGLAVEPDQEWEGKPYQRLVISQGDEPALRLWIDPTAHLIRRMEYVLDAKDVAGHAPSGSDLTGLTMQWLAGAIETDEPKPDAFDFKPAAELVRIKSAEPKPAAAAGPPRNELIGKLAPDFSITVLDGPGKTKTVTRADLAGKVVLIDFWATWCGPCMMELPEIQKIADSYAKLNKTEVVILAVSQDREPEDGSKVRDLVEKVLDAKKLALASGPIARVALDSDQSMGEAFKVEGIPTVVILDAKGVVQTVHVGYNEDVKDVLTADIDHLLEGKAIAPQTKVDVKK